MNRTSFQTTIAKTQRDRIPQKRFCNVNILALTQKQTTQVFSCLKSTMETPEQCLKFVES